MPASKRRKYNVSSLFPISESIMRNAWRENARRQLSSIRRSAANNMKATHESKWHRATRYELHRNFAASLKPVITGEVDDRSSAATCAAMLNEPGVSELIGRSSAIPGFDAPSPTRSDAFIGQTR
jgi:hypothetical protein